MKFFRSLIVAALPLISRAELIPLASRQTTTTTTTTGDRQCSTTMCVSATVNGTTVSYVLESLKGTPGWMGMGIGTQMAGSPMFILWQNSDGTITLSQRKGTGEVEPQVDPSPPRIATKSDSLSSTSGTVQYAFTLDADSTTKQDIIYGYGDKNPGNPATNADLAQHTDNGGLTLDLTKALSSGSGSGSGGSGSGSGSGSGGYGDSNGSGSGSNSNSPNSSDSNSSHTDTTPLTPHQRLIVAHAVCCLLGFLFFLPSGVFLARYFRTSTSKWFFGHWIIQWLIAGSVILVGVILGIAAVSQGGAMHLDDDHKRWGIVLFILYIVQCSLGAFIHFVKLSKSGRRPPQNYFHAILGLTIIGLALYQVYTGYRTEWPKYTGRIISNTANIIWYIWVVLLPAFYLIGLVLLPRQFKQEAESRYKARLLSESTENISMSNKYRG